MQIIEKHKNCLGTMDFTLKMGKMKRVEVFCTYPIQNGEKSKIINLQSSHRWANLNIETGEIELSARRNQYANWQWLIHCKVNGTMETDKCTPEQLNEMLTAIRGTANQYAGTNGIMYCDNSDADKI